jgi:hypothetical protein
MHLEKEFTELRPLTSACLIACLPDRAHVIPREKLDTSKYSLNLALGYFTKISWTNVKI